MKKYIVLEVPKERSGNEVLKDLSNEIEIAKHVKDKKTSDAVIDGLTAIKSEFLFGMESPVVLVYNLETKKLSKDRGKEVDKYYLRIEP